MTKALILAAGIASRLRPLTNNTPKCLLDVGGKTILSRAIDNLLINGIDAIVLVTGYLEHTIKEHIGTHYPQLNVEYIYNPVFESTNNIYSLWLARDVMSGYEMLLLDSDILFMPETIHALRSSPHENCLALRRAEVGHEEVKVLLDNEQRILKISKEVPANNAAGESVGIERFSTQWVADMYRLLDRIITVDGRSDIFYEAAFEEMIEQGQQLYAVDVSPWPCMELDTIADIEHARKVLAPLLSH